MKLFVPSAEKVQLELTSVGKLLAVVDEVGVGVGVAVPLFPLEDDPVTALLEDENKARLSLGASQAINVKRVRVMTVNLVFIFYP
jgi:hypothetical protein